MSILVPDGTEQREPECSRPDLNRSLSVYCFGDASPDERDRFEAHLLDCDVCWHEVQRLEAVVHALRTDKSLTRQRYAPDIIGMAGISSKFTRVLAGHWLHGLAASLLYSLMMSVSVFMEIAYEYDRFEETAWVAAPVVFAWTLLTTLAALLGDWKVTRSGRQDGLLVSLVLVLIAASVLYLLLKPFLPAYSVTQATFQTWTAQAAYLKGLVYSASFTAVFLLVPFHFVLVMQRQLSAGRHRMALELLTGSSFAVPPPGALYLPVWLYGLLLIAGAVYSLVSTAHLLEALKETQYTNLFILTIQIRWALFLLLGLECLAWYYTMLNELKRECIVARRLANQ